jgi:hypothetical protein
MNNGCIPKQHIKYEKHINKCDIIDTSSTTKGNQTKYTKETLKNLLANNTLEVRFTKQNGENRVMTCTTMSDNIPAEFQPKGDIKEDTHPTQVRVFDLEAEGWRSFLSTSVLEVRIV